MHNFFLKILSILLLPLFFGCALLSTGDRIAKSMYTTEEFHVAGKGKTSHMHCTSAFSKKGILIVLDGTETYGKALAKISFYNPHANILITTSYETRTTFNHHSCSLNPPSARDTVDRISFHILTDDAKKEQLKYILSKNASKDDVFKAITSTDHPFLMQNMVKKQKDWELVTMHTKTGALILEIVSKKISFTPQNNLEPFLFPYTGTFGRLLNEMVSLQTY
ncbi:MAG: hypothetical protein WC539_02985 [Nitrospirota bacterium]